MWMAVTWIQQLPQTSFQVFFRNSWISAPKPPFYMSWFSHPMTSCPLEGVRTQWTYSNQPTFNNSTHAQSNSHFVCQPSLENCHADSDLWVSRDQIRIPPSGSQPDRESNSKSVPTTHTNPLLMGKAYGWFHSRQSMHRVFTQTC